MKVRFEPSGVEAQVGPGTRLVDVTDEHPEAAVAYSCRAATCGTCRVQVVEGLEALEAADEEEQDVLRLFGDGPTIRLCCQLRVAHPVDRIVLRVLG
jgi:2Fe-2S ferredoxin